MYGMSIRYQCWQNIGRDCMDYKSNLNKFGYPVEMLSCLLLADGGCALSTWWWSSCVVCQEWYGQLPQGPLSCGAGSGGRGPHTLSQTGPGHLVMEEERGEYKESRATLTYSAHYQTFIILVDATMLHIQVTAQTVGKVHSWNRVCKLYQLRFDMLWTCWVTVLYSMTSCSENCLSTFFWLDSLLRVRETWTRQVSSGAQQIQQFFHCFLSLTTASTEQLCPWITAWLREEGRFIGTHSTANWHLW